MVSNKMLYKLTVLWPGFTAFNEPQILFFKTILDKFDTEIYFISDISYSKNRTENVRICKDFLNNKRIHQLKFPHFRLRGLNIFQIVKLFFVISKILINRKSDAILSSTQFALHSKIAFLLSKILNIKFFVYTEVWQFVKEKNVLLLIYHRLSHFIVKHADCVFVQGKFKKNIYTKKGIHPNKIFVLPFLISDMKEGALGNQRVKRNRIRKYLFIGRLIPIKGIDILIKAFVELSKSHDDVELFVGGEGELMNQLQLLCKDIKAPNIKFLGWLDREKKYSLSQEVDYFVLPSIKNDNLVEGWGLVLQEAISMGLPVIATDAVGSAWDFVQDGINGYIVKNNDVNALYDAMEKVYRMSDEEYSEAARTSRQIFEEYNSRETLVRTLKEAIRK